MGLWLSFPILGILLLLQTTIVSRIQLLHGTADIILLALMAWSLQKRNKFYWQWTLIASALVSVASGLPFGAPFLGYGLANGVALFIKKYIWQAPVLAMLVVTILGTLLNHIVSIVALSLAGVPLSVSPALAMITLPSVVLNLLVALPVYVIFHDLAGLLYPETIEL